MTGNNSQCEEEEEEEVVLKEREGTGDGPILFFMLLQ
jgi:hypothetical protein